MSLWNPPTSVGKGEFIGRRLFDEPLLAGAQNQGSLEGLDLRHFQETRDDEWSVDRLGASGITAAVVRYLKPCADENGKNFHRPKRFDGWATIQVKTLCSQKTGSGAEASNLCVTPSPIASDSPDNNDLRANPFHAHITKPVSLDRLHMALILRHFFTRFGKVELIRHDSPDK